MYTKPIFGSAVLSGGTLAHTGTHNAIGYAVAAATLVLAGFALKRFANSFKKG
jgi:LPXTG-motif cell wall-anchored protein